MSSATAAPRERVGARLRVLQSVKRPSARTNPYVVQLVDSLSEQFDVHYFSWRFALFGDYDVLQLHWPEVMMRRAGWLQRSVARLRFVLLMLRLTIRRRIVVVRTLHNNGAHESGGRIERLLLAWCDRRTDHWIALNADTRAPRDGRLTVILHGDYRGWYQPYPLPPSVTGRFLYFGLIRPYKGVDTLIDAFGSIEDAAPALRIVGHPEGAALRALVEDACRADHRITALLDYVDDATLATEVGQAELVVLPYQDMHNSGALLLALSLGRPALVPRTPVTLALAEEVGTDWVHTYSGPLTGAVLTDVLDRLRLAEVTGTPDLGRRSWTLIAAQHAALYRELTGRA